tara:strand:- start:280 stop:531 length:252 start_codon:yes stop_codon:yes gene_type:complete
MKYVLVDKLDNINTSVELEERIGLHGATIYFQSMKKMPDDGDFDKLWRVMTKDQYDTHFKTTLQNRQVEWWKEEDSFLDGEKS